MSDAFALLNITPKANLSLAALNASYEEKRKVTQDDHACARLNEAFTVLKDPVARAELVLAQKGITVDASADLPASCLMDFFEWQESLDGMTAIEGQQELPKLRDALSHELSQIDKESDAELIKVALLRARYIARLITTLKRKVDELL